MVDFDRLKSAYLASCQELLERRNAAGHWEGRLSSSALSTATAVSALAVVRRHLERDESPPSLELQARLGKLIFGGLDWLVQAQNSDGGWGDTDRSLSNIATTMLVRAAFQLTCVPADHADILERAGRYIRDLCGVAGLRRRYGRDKTFAVPILTNCALAGLVSWKEVSPLPFELACLPQSWFRLLRLPVVSYAIPALVAIGQARYFHRRPLNPLVRWWRGRAVGKSLRVLEQMQPASGGFLEATPLTSFVLMSLASIGQSQHPVARRSLEFVMNSVRGDGSWPIDTNLATWVTTLSINALNSGDSEVAAEAGGRCADWLLECQCRQVHPYTGAAPGGWGWSDLSGSVPDADDTSGAILALAGLARHQQTSGSGCDSRLVDAASLGVQWLLDLQNFDGGWPTFCRGWGKLPFDRSGTDLTAHALRALHAWRKTLDAGSDECASATPTTGNRRAPGRVGLASSSHPTYERIDRAIESGLRYLARQQQTDGSWAPLWFGNQHHPREQNPIYGTARVLLAYHELGQGNDPCARRAAAWLASQQRRDGAWGAQPSVEETALAIEALLAIGGGSAYDQHVERGLNWLIEAVETGRFRNSSPIGFYFAKLWYYEALYPVIFTVSALGRAVRRFEPIRFGHRVDRRPAPHRPTGSHPPTAPHPPIIAEPSPAHST